MSDLIAIGVEIGQKRSPTAICVVEVENRKEPKREINHFVVRFLERMPLATPYPEIGQRLHKICTDIRQNSGQIPSLYVNATGLGRPVIEELEEEVPDAVSIWPVSFNHGDQMFKVDGQVRLGKAYLVSRLQVLLQTHRIRLPETDETRKLGQELREYEIQVVPDANERYGAFQVGTQDDLVTALGLAVLEEYHGVQIF